MKPSPEVLLTNQAYRKTYGAASRRGKIVFINWSWSLTECDFWHANSVSHIGLWNLSQICFRWFIMWSALHQYAWVAIWSTLHPEQCWKNSSSQAMVFYWQLPHGAADGLTRTLPAALRSISGQCWAAVSGVIFACSWWFGSLKPRTKWTSSGRVKLVEAHGPLPHINGTYPDFGLVVQFFSSCSFGCILQSYLKNKGPF